MKRDGHIMATDLMLWCANNEPAAPAPGKDDFHMETVCTLVNIIGNAARSSVKVCNRDRRVGLYRAKICVFLLPLTAHRYIALTGSVVDTKGTLEAVNEPLRR